MICEFIQLGSTCECKKCGRRVIFSGDIATLKARCRSGSSCTHLGDPTGETALIDCPTCTGRVRLKFPVNACAVWGQCLPTAITAEPTGYHLCKGCEQYSPSAPAPPP